MPVHSPHLASSTSPHYQIPSQFHHNQALCNCNVHSSSYISSHSNQLHQPLQQISNSFPALASGYSQNNFCSIHASEYVPPPPPAPTQAPPNSSFYHLQQNLPHSKSLDQYDSGGKPNGNIHRLSLDHNYNDNFSNLNHQPPTAGLYDCIETIALNHPYNQPNARSPLPYNLISNNSLGQVQVPSQQQVYPSEWGYYHQLHQQLPTPVSDYKNFTDFTDSSSPAMPDSELISFNDTSSLSKLDGKLRSSLKKSSHEHNNQELEYLRLLKKRERLSCSDANSRTHDDVIAELDSMNISSNGHGPPKGHQSSNKNNGVAGSSIPSVKLKTKSISTSTEISSDYFNQHEHKRTSKLETKSSDRSNSDKYKPPQQPQIIVPPGEWSCRFCTFLNPNAKKICEMCSKSKDFFLDADKTTSTATCV